MGDTVVSDGQSCPNTEIGVIDDRAADSGNDHCSDNELKPLFSACSVSTGEDVVNFSLGQVLVAFSIFCLSVGLALRLVLITGHISAIITCFGFVLLSVISAARVTRERYLEPTDS